jgi:hypothetical protein
VPVKGSGPNFVRPEHRSVPRIPNFDLLRLRARRDSRA